jgi:hypothetical protein
VPIPDRNYCKGVSLADPFVLWRPFTNFTFRHEEKNEQYMARLPPEQLFGSLDSVLGGTVLYSNLSIFHNCCRDPVKVVAH